jgi:hypothetical protein
VKLHQFLSTVPKAVRIAACAVVCCAVLIGLVLGITGRPIHCPTAPHALNGLVGMGGGLLTGTLAAIWILCLGYVYADARRRAMPPVLWALLAALVPNLLGFLFYFALRRPTASQCPQCGRAVEAGQRFCPSCGLEQSSSAQFSSASSSEVTPPSASSSGAEGPH